MTMPHQMPLRRQWRGKVRVSPVGTPTAQKLIRLIHASAPCFPRPLQHHHYQGLRGSHASAQQGPKATAHNLIWSVYAEALQASVLHRLQLWDSSGHRSQETGAVQLADPGERPCRSLHNTLRMQWRPPLKG